MTMDNELTIGLQDSSRLGNVIGVKGVGGEQKLVTYDTLHELLSSDKHK